MSKLYNICFSATGRAKKVADIVCGALGKDETYVDLSATDFQPIELSPFDIAVVVVPSYGGRVPIPATERLQQIKGNGATALFVAVFGNRAIDDTLIELEDILLKQGFRASGAIEAVAEHSLMPRFGIGRPDEKDIAELTAFARQFKEKLGNDGLSEQVVVPGNRPYVKLSAMPIHPKANKACIKCGVCSEKCPVGAIPKENPNLTDKSKCIACMRCVEVCTKNARSVPSFPLKLVAILAKKKFAGRKENKLYL